MSITVTRTEQCCHCGRLYDELVRAEASVYVDECDDEVDLPMFCQECCNYEVVHARLWELAEEIVDRYFDVIKDEDDDDWESEFERDVAMELATEDVFDDLMEAFEESHEYPFG